MLPNVTSIVAVGIYIFVICVVKRRSNHDIAAGSISLWSFAEIHRNKPPTPNAIYLPHQSRMMLYLSCRPTQTHQCDTEETGCVEWIETGPWSHNTFQHGSMMPWCVWRRDIYTMVDNDKVNLGCTIMMSFSMLYISLWCLLSTHVAFSHLW